MNVGPAPKSERRIFLGMPGYGELTAGAARGFWRASRLPDANIYYQYNEGSLLAANFNTLWAKALNLCADESTRPDYFAMQHADIDPEDYWLDTLIEELEARDLDVLGVAVPIKDHKGLTSIALARPDDDRWRPLCRLTMTEIYRLPETFTSDDVGHPLLLNTGLWVCRFDLETCKKLHFTINDRIIQYPDGTYAAQCEPEDWFFSRLCHEVGLRVGCTRKVKVTHRGPANFTSARVWGVEDYDRSWIDHSPLDDLDPAEHFTLPGGIPGWLTHAEGRELARLAAGKRVLEVGSYAGLSTVCLARTAERVMCVDTFDGRGTAHPADTLSMFKRNLERYGVADQVEWIRATLAEAIKLRVIDIARGESDLFLDRVTPFDLIFIDGDHSEAAVRADIEAALPLLAPGGLIAFHDYRNHLDPGVGHAVDALIGRGGNLVSLTDSLAVVSPPAATPSLLEV